MDELEQLKIIANDTFIFQAKVTIKLIKAVLDYISNDIDIDNYNNDEIVSLCKDLDSVLAPLKHWVIEQ